MAKSSFIAVDYIDEATLVELYSTTILVLNEQPS